MKEVEGAHLASEGGFTLIEVLIAFIIVALTLGVVYRGMLDGVAAGHVATATREALSRARSHLDAIGHGMTPGAFTQSGEDGHHFHWRITMTPLEHRGGTALYHVTVMESWPDAFTLSGQRAVTLSSLCSGPAEGTP